MKYTDLVIDAFLILRETFFDKDMRPIPFNLRDKRNTQDNPLDEHIRNILKTYLEGAICQKAPGPLINPDLVIYRPKLCNEQPRELLANDTTRIVGIEVKKLERGKSGRIARASGMDYNTTPPCGTILAYSKDQSEFYIKGFYLFLAQENVSKGQYIISAMALCDGNILNEDVDFYLRIVGQRQKEICLGTYGNGVNRNRPMLIFANPLGASELDREATVVSNYVDDHRVDLVYKIERESIDGINKRFYAYRKRSDIPKGWKVQILREPFPQPSNRVSTTQARGRFQLPIKVR
jgi:hypothetical protein